MQTCDLMIEAGWVIPVEPHRVVLRDHAVVVDGGEILAILPVAEAWQRYAAREHARLPDSALLPGLVNAHTHNPMTLMRGLADDLPLMDWLHNHIWPAEAAVMSAEFCADGAELAVAEMLRGGTTCCNENYFFPEAIGATYQRLGIRCLLGLPVIDFPTAWASGPEACLEQAQAAHDSFAGDALIDTALAPHAPYTVGDAAFTRIASLSAELGIKVHCHVHETAQEVSDSLQQHGVRPLARLDRLGLVNERLIAVHMTQLLPEEIERCAEASVAVVHCPESNLKLASGFAPVEALRRAGVTLALGTDGCASNNDLDMFGEMRTAALLAKVVADDAAALDAASTLRMATLGGAQALGMADRIGSIEPGKRADLIAVRLDELESLPLFDPISQLVYAGNRRQVHRVWIDGQSRLENGEIPGMDLEAVAARARAWGERVATATRKHRAGAA